MPQALGVQGVGPPPETEVVKDYHGGAPRYKVRIEMILFLEDKISADALTCYLDQGRRDDAIALLHGVVDKLVDDKKSTQADGAAAKKLIEVAIDPTGHAVVKAPSDTGKASAKRSATKRPRAGASK